MSKHKGSIRLIARLDKTGIAADEYGSDHVNNYRGLDDAALGYFDAAAARVASHLKDTGGPHEVTLQSVITRNDGRVTDSGSHVFKGVSTKAKNLMNREILKVGTELLAMAEAKA